MRNRIRRSGTLVAVFVLFAMMFSIGPAQAAMPNFQLPFPCNEVWHASTYNDSPHPAIDWNAYPGDDGRTVVASAGGTASLYHEPLGGYQVIINHGGGWQTVYAHLKQAGRVSGSVSAGQTIGYVGNTGGLYPNGTQVTFSPHLHWEQIYNNQKQTTLYANGSVVTPGLVANSSAPAYKSNNCSTPAAGPNDPKGNFEVIQQVHGGIRLKGWALDPNTSDPIAVHVYEGSCCSNPRGAFTAQDARPDVASVFPATGENHGFDLFFSMPNGISGSKTYCIYAINVGAGNVSPEIGCRTVNFNWNPVGNYENIVRSPGGVNLIGWTLDPETSDPIAVHVYEGSCCNNPRGATTANSARPDVATAMPGYGENHGFNVHISAAPTEPATKTYCVFGINTGYGNVSPELGCRSLTISPNVEGNYEGIEVVPGGARIFGWAIDPDVSASVGVHVYDNGALVHMGTASIARPDVLSHWPYYGENHGFNATLSLGSGVHNICVYAINDNTSAGNNRDMGCKQVTVS